MFLDYLKEIEIVFCRRGTICLVGNELRISSDKSKVLYVKVQLVIHTFPQHNTYIDTSASKDSGQCALRLSRTKEQKIDLVPSSPKPRIELTTILTSHYRCPLYQLIYHDYIGGMKTKTVLLLQVLLIHDYFCVLPLRRYWKWSHSVIHLAFFLR